jgi:LmbE family N-acetylglucosaminyl deacetylase
MNLTNKRILVLAPHTDDGEFGCGGSIAKFVADGNEVFYAAFSACQQSVLPHFPSDVLITEVKAATKILGIKPENLLLFDFKVRTFSDRRQEILDELIRLRSKINPDLVLMPSLDDLHQDHKTIATEALRAFKFDSILSYELPWNNLSFHTSCFIHLNETYINIKIAALQEYKSQAYRPYSNADFIKSLARVRGVQINSHFAETFEIVRWLM